MNKTFDVSYTFLKSVNFFFKIRASAAEIIRHRPDDNNFGGDVNSSC